MNTHNLSNKKGPYFYRPITLRGKVHLYLLLLTYSLKLNKLYALACLLMNQGDGILAGDC